MSARSLVNRDDDMDAIVDLFELNGADHGPPETRRGVELLDVLDRFLIRGSIEHIARMRKALFALIVVRALPPLEEVGERTRRDGIGEEARGGRFLHIALDLILKDFFAEVFCPRK